MCYNFLFLVFLYWIFNGKSLFQPPQQLMHIMHTFLVVLAIPVCHTDIKHIQLHNVYINVFLIMLIQRFFPSSQAHIIILFSLEVFPLYKAATQLMILFVLMYALYTLLYVLYTSYLIQNQLQRIYFYKISMKLIFLKISMYLVTYYQLIV